MAGQRPKARITFKYKDRDKGWANELECAVWPPNDNAPDGAPDNVRFPKGAQIKLADGTVHNADDFWIGYKAMPQKSEGEDFNF